MRHRDTKYSEFFSRALRALQVFVISACMAVFVTACGGGSADEPSSPRAVSSGASAAVITGGGGSVAAGPRPVGSTQGASTASGTTTQGFTQGSSEDFPQDLMQGSTVNACGLEYLNETRFAGSGLQAIGIDDAIECGLCPSAEICTNPENICQCIVTAPVTSSVAL